MTHLSHRDTSSNCPLRYKPSVDFTNIQVKSFHFPRWSKIGHISSIAAAAAGQQTAVLLHLTLLPSVPSTADIMLNRVVTGWGPLLQTVTGISTSALHT